LPALIVTPLGYFRLGPLPFRQLSLTPYTISEEDVAGPFRKAIPASLVEMARLPGLSYTSPLSEIAEKFHMSPNLLRELNPHADFWRAGTAILVADAPEMKLRSGRFASEAVPPAENADPTVATIVVDKPARNVRAYDRDGKLLAFYPATIGSEEKPAPSGVFKVRRVDWNPQYHYDPKFAWKGVNTNKKLTVQPGPNNPALPASGVSEDIFGYTANESANNLSASSTLTVVVTAPGLTYVAAPAGGPASQPNGGHYAVLDGTAGNATLNAANGVGAALVGGNGDTLNGANSGKDTFVFMGDFGQNTINGYIGKATGSFDVIQLSAADFGNIPGVIFSDAKQMGPNIVITDPMNSHDTITLAGVSLSSLHFDASHFLLV
jgi:lipoprotein-anchoring transpeptidase ErfK/SrfK